MIKQIVKRVFIVVWFLSGLCLFAAMIDKSDSFDGFMMVSMVSVIVTIGIASAQFICLGTVDPRKLLDK